MKNLLLLFAWVLLTGSTLSAQLTLTDPSPVSALTVCTETPFNVLLTRNPGSFITTDSVVLLITAPTNMTFGVPTSNAGTLTYSQPAANQQRIRIMGLSGTSVQVTYALRPGCDYFQSTTTTAQQNTIAASFNGTPSGSLTTQGYNVSSAWLAFSSGLSLRQNFALAAFNVPFTRRLVYVNTSSTPFSGDFTFRDTTEFTASVSVVQLQGLSVAHPTSGFTQTSLTANDTVLEVTGQITGLGAGDSIVLLETLTVVGCPTTTNTSITHFNLVYGCQGGTQCRSVGFAQTSAALDPNNKPQIGFRDLNIARLCPADPDTHLFAFINTGNGLADTLYVQLEKELSNNISYFDTNSFELFRLVGNVEVPVPYVVQTYNMHPSGLTPTHPWRFFVATDQPPAPGDTVFMRYHEEKLCLDGDTTHFNSYLIMNGITERAKLGHPCFPTGFPNTDPTHTAWGDPTQIFSLNQLFENYIGAMNDGDEAWFAISNQSPLTMNANHGYFPNEVFLDSGKVEFQVEIVLEQGLGLVLDSMALSSFQSGTDSIWYPDSFTYAEGDGFNRGTGDTLTASFVLPNYFFQTNTGGAYRLAGAELRKSPSFLSFFNRFSVVFKLKSYCQYSPPDSKSSVKERTFLVYDNTCSPECRLPLSQIEDEINLLCPGCILPGWNLSRFDIVRTNFGVEDADNNNYPDTYPTPTANSPNLRVRRACIGDTLQFTLEGHTSDGEDLLFNNIGFEYDYGQLRIQGALLDHLSFLGAQGTYTKNNVAYPFTVPPAGGVFTAGRFDINLDVATLISYGVPSTALDSMDIGDEIFIEPIMRVETNLDNGTGADPDFSVEQLDAWMYMSGVPITNSLVDANLDVPYLRDSLTGPQRAGYLYWCTGFTGRVTGIGVHFQDYAIMDNYSGIWGVTGVNMCYKKLRMVAFADVGETHSSTYWDHDASNQSALNAFSFEVRDFFRLDSLSFTVPQDYVLNSVLIRISSIMLDTVSNQSGYVCSPDWYTPYNYPLTGVTTVDSTVTIYPANYYAQLTDPQGYPICNSTSLWSGDETKRVYVELILQMADCDSTRDSIHIGGAYPITSHWSNYPGVGDTIITRNMPNGYIIDKPSAELATQAIPVILNTSSSNLSWTVNLSTVSPTSYFWDYVVNGVSYNTFVGFVSPNNTINVTGVVHTNGPATTNLGPIGGIPTWGLGTIGYGTLYAMQINATYNCANNFGLDSLYILTGWNCYGYPSDLQEACYMDTTVVYVSPALAGLQATLTSDSVVNACDTLHYELELKATGSGDVNNVQVQLNLPPGLTYITGSGLLSYESNSAAINPVSNLWDLDLVGFFAGNFDGSHGSAFLSFDVLAGCSFSNTQPLELVVRAENYCGQVIGPISLQRSPSVVLGLPTPDMLTVSGQTIVSDGCAGTATLGVTYENIGAQVTAGDNTLIVTLPTGTTWTGGTAYTNLVGQVLSYDLPVGLAAGASQTVTIQVSGLASIACGELNVPLSLLLGASLTCDTTTCISLVDTVSGSCVLEVARPDIALSALDLNGLCNGGGITVTVTNNGIASTGMIPINIYCMDGVNNGCLMGTTSLTSFGAGSSVNLTIPISNACGGCTTILVTAGEEACVCGVAELLDSIDCPQNGCELQCPDDIYARVKCDEKGCYLDCKARPGEHGSGGHGSGSGSGSGGHGSGSGGHGSGHVGHGGHGSGNGSYNGQCGNLPQGPYGCPECWHMGCDDEETAAHHHERCRPKCDIHHEGGHGSGGHGSGSNGSGHSGSGHSGSGYTGNTGSMSTSGSSGHGSGSNGSGSHGSGGHGSGSHGSGGHGSGGHGSGGHGSGGHGSGGHGSGGHGSGSHGSGSHGSGSHGSGSHGSGSHGSGSHGSGGHGSGCNDCCHASLHNIGCPILVGDCEIKYISNDAPVDDVYPLGTTVVNWTVIDNHGNTYTCDQNVTITMGYEAVVTSVVDDGPCKHVTMELYCNEATCDLKRFAIEVPCGKIDEQSLQNSAGLPMAIENHDPATGWYGISLYDVAGFCNLNPSGLIKINYTICDKFCDGEIAFISEKCVEYDDIHPFGNDHQTKARSAAFPDMDVFPNPFSRETTIRFDLPATEQVQLWVYNVNGQVIETLADAKLAAGKHEFTWTPDPNMADGVYMIALRCPSMERTRRVVLAR